MDYQWNNVSDFNDTSIASENEALENVEKTQQDENPPKESVEQMLDSFSDMLQSEMHTIADELKTVVLQTAGLNQNAMHEFTDKFVHVIEQQEMTIQKQHLSLTKFQEDLLYKTQKALILEIIEIADNIRMMLQDQEKQQDYSALLDSVKKLEEWVQATLSNNSVRRFCDTETSVTELNRKRQEVIDVEVTNDPTKHNTYVCERPGYIWTMPYLVVNSDVQFQKILEENGQPQAFSYVIRPEEVVKLKYKEE